MSEGATAPDRLRVLFVTEDDPLYVIQFFRVFLDACPRDEIELVGITVDRAFHEPLVRTARRMLRFYGPVDFVRLCGRFAAAKLRRSSIERLAVAAGVPLVPTESVNDPAYVERVRALAPDVIASVAAPEIFRADILRAARRGCVNIHSGRLPVYRGMMPNFWQMLHGEPHAVVTVHEMVEKLDAGAVLGTVEVPIRSPDALDRLIVETKRLGARLMIDVLRRFRAGDVPRTPIDMSDASYFSFPKPEDVRAFRAKGHRML
ncbi:MAG: methionyl-tRNA formyltransferase [Planctomycetota bacterium]|jgi:methionyl-tRNA formyltransferase